VIDSNTEFVFFCLRCESDLVIPEAVEPGILGHCPHCDRWVKDTDAVLSGFREKDEEIKQEYFSYLEGGNNMRLDLLQEELETLLAIETLEHNDNNLLSGDFKERSKIKQEILSSCLKRIENRNKATEGNIKKQEKSELNKLGDYLRRYFSERQSEGTPVDNAIGIMENYRRKNNFVKKPLELQEPDKLHERLNFLQQQDGEQWAIAESVKRILGTKPYYS